MAKVLVPPVKAALFVGITIIIAFTGMTSSLGRYAFGDNEAHFNAGIEIFSDTRFEKQGWIFTRGSVVYLSAWSNAYTDGESGLITTPHSNFTIDIVGPGNKSFFYQKLIADAQGNIHLTVPITQDFDFGIYDVRYTVEHEGYTTISHYSDDPDVSYSPARLFITWTHDDTIDVSHSYRLEIIEPSINNTGTSKEFGSDFNLKMKLCPAPIGLVPDHGFLEPTTGEILLDNQGPAIVVNAELKPLDEQTGFVGRNMTTFVREDSCSIPFEIQTGTLVASGKWSVTGTAQWLQKNDTRHVFQTLSDKATFNVAETVYRSTIVNRINLDTDKYRNTVPLDWSPDGDSILFSHEGAPGEGQKLAILHLNSDNQITDLDISSPYFVDMGYPSPYTTKFSSTGDSIILLLGPDLYRYDLARKDLVRLTNSSTIVSFDVASDGRIYYNSNGSLVIADEYARNPKVILEPGEHEIYIGDISPDGNKILYRKYLESAPEWQDAILAYYDINERKEHEIPNIHNGCGSFPKWAPNGFHIIFHESSCSMGWPGGILSVTDLNGSFREYLIPTSNDNPAYFIFSPDGSSILVGFGNYINGGAVDSLGGPANFYIMTLARPMPELSSNLILPIAISVIILGMSSLFRFRVNLK